MKTYRSRCIPLLAMVFVFLGAATARAAAPAITFTSGSGLTVTAVKQLDQRLYALTVTTKAIPAALNVRILVPSDYAAEPHTRYPVLYLYHGTLGTASDWTVKGNAEQATAGRNLIVVMPDIAINYGDPQGAGDGGGGWCANWPDGAQEWETYLIQELIPWVQANLRTLHSRAERAVAGLSQGGFCSMSVAAQYPQLFGEALAYSGVPDIAWDPSAHLAAMGIINATEVGLDQVPPDSMFGNPLTDFLNWADHDPATLANNLRWTKMYIYFGNGEPGPYDTTPADDAGGSIEAAVYEDNLDFHQRLEQLGITPTVYDPYGPGTHSWPYWDRDLDWSIGPLMADFAHPAPDPTSFSFQAADADYSIYGWSVAIHRDAQEFSTLAGNGADGFTLAGSGTAVVTTPADYKAGHAYAVTTTDGSATSTVQVRASRSRRLVVPVDLGPSDSVQEYTVGEPPASSVGTTVYTARVRIAPVDQRRWGDGNPLHEQGQSNQGTGLIARGADRRALRFRPGPWARGPKRRRQPRASPRVTEA